MSLRMKPPARVHTTCGTKITPPSHIVLKRPSRYRAKSVNPRFADANAAIIAGPDNDITIVDIDAEGTYYPDMIAEMCGETPYMVKTPSGGHAAHSYT